MIEVRINHVAPHEVSGNPYGVRGFVSWCIKIKGIKIANMVEYPDNYLDLEYDYRLGLANRVQMEIETIIYINGGALSQVVVPTVGEIVSIISRSSK